MPKQRKKLSPLTVIGELLLLGGVGVFGFLLWQPWYTNTIIAEEQTSISANLSASWQSAGSTTAVTDGVPVPTLTGDGQVFGVLYVPAFGREWANQVASGSQMNPIMDDKNLGIAHYPTTALPGEIGNVALAAHRAGGFTTPFHDTDYLRVGDPVFLETPDGWYTYRFRSYEYVLPTQVDVLNPFPRITDVEASDSILTFTTCNPKYYGIDERLIAYSVFESFTPRQDGPPAELLAENPHLAAQYDSKQQVAQSGGEGLGTQTAKGRN